MVLNLKQKKTKFSGLEGLDISELCITDCFQVSVIYIFWKKKRVMLRSNWLYQVHCSPRKKSVHLVRIVTVACGMVKQSIWVHCVQSDSQDKLASQTLGFRSKIYASQNNYLLGQEGQKSNQAGCAQWYFRRIVQRGVKIGSPFLSIFLMLSCVEVLVWNCLVAQFRR